MFLSGGPSAVVELSRAGHRNFQIAAAPWRQFLRKLVKAAEYSVCQRESGGRFWTIS